MYCENCPTIISKALNKISGVKNALINYKDSSAKIELLDGNYTDDEIDSPIPLL